MADSCDGIYTLGACVDRMSCRYIMDVPRVNRCQYSQDVDDCHSEGTLFQYMQILACKCNDTDNQMYYCSLVFVTHLVYYFFIMALLSEFFTPSLCYVSNVLGMSENLAGATLLALGNGAADVVTSMVEATTLGPEVVLLQVLGTAIHATTIATGVLILTKPFSLKPWPFYRSVLPLLVSTSFILFMYGGGNLYLHEPFVYLLLFFTYMAMYCIQECCFRSRSKSRKSSLRKSPSSASQSPEPEGSHLTPSDHKTVKTMVIQKRPSTTGRSYRVVTTLLNELLEEERTAEETSEIERRKESLEKYGVNLPPPVIARERPIARTGTLTATLQAERQHGLHMLGFDEQARDEAIGHPTTVGVEFEGQILYKKRKQLWKDFCCHMIPVDHEAWLFSGHIGKILQLLEAPPIYVLKLFVPCVHEGVLCNNWCKLLACIHCFTFPILLLWAVGINNYQWMIFLPVVATSATLAIVFSALILATAYVRIAPRYHMVFAMIGIVATAVIIYGIANEVIAIMQSLGSILGLSTGILCLIILPWGNGVQDIVNNIQLAKAGYSMMAYAGSYASAGVVALVSLFFAFIMIIMIDGDGYHYTYERHYSGLIYSSLFFMLTLLVFTLCIVPTIGYHFRRSYAIFLLILLVMFIIFSFMIESNLIEPLAK